VTKLGGKWCCFLQEKKKEEGEMREGERGRRLTSFNLNIINEN
jgi:hypothetical protein